MDARIGQDTVALLGRPASTGDGQPSLTAEDAVALVRAHVDLEKVRTTDYDDELWTLWCDEVRRAEDGAHNADVLDHVLARVRDGE